jgi:hypothetical protein
MEAEDRRPQLAAVAILFLTLVWLSVSLRCYVRTVMIKSLGTDDWLAAAPPASWASPVGRTATQVLRSAPQIHNGVLQSNKPIKLRELHYSVDIGS